jgi:hypothetical protein
MRQLSERLRNWFEPNPEFYNGTLTIQSVRECYPRIGEKMKFLDGQFYVEATTRSWSYGGKMQATIEVTRGAIYDGNGRFQKPMEGVSKRVRLLV